MSNGALLWHQFRFERRQFWRNPSAAFFNFLLPLILLFLIASVFASDRDELDVIVPGIAGMAIMATTFTALAHNITFLREQGVLKRVRGTPLPTGVYLGGLIGSAVLNAVIQVLLVFTIGDLVYDVPWAAAPLEVAGYTALGVACFGALGIAFAHAIPNVDSAPAYENAVFLPVIFISGVFYSADSLPAVLSAVAQALPLKHVIDGLSGDGGATALAVVGGWAVAGAVLAVRYFRWE